jgi:hypothetical protein
MPLCSLEDCGYLNCGAEQAQEWLHRTPGPLGRACVAKASPQLYSSVVNLLCCGHRP